MRKQYHFRPSENGFFAWDVDKLVELTKDLPVVEVPLSEIKELDEPYWYGEGHSPTCRELLVHFQLVNECDLAYPIILCSDGRIMDGMHRVVKATLENKEVIKAVRFDKTPKPDYVNVQPDELPY